MYLFALVNHRVQKSNRHTLAVPDDMLPYFGQTAPTSRLETDVKWEDSRPPPL